MGERGHVLDRDRVGIRDDFFKLGGHSLLLMELATRIADRLGAEVALQDQFEAGDVTAMAELADAAPSAAQSDDEAVIAVRAAKVRPQ